MRQLHDWAARRKEGAASGGAGSTAARAMQVGPGKTKGGDGRASEPAKRARETDLGKEHVKQRSIVHKGDLGGIDPFFPVLGQLIFENLLVEKVLQLLVGDVDAKLLERVDRKVLEPEDVENPDLLSGLPPHARIPAAACADPSAYETERSDHAENAMKTGSEKIQGIFARASPAVAFGPKTPALEDASGSQHQATPVSAPKVRGNSRAGALPPS